jgi:bla regulator protein blaR1
MTADFWLHNLLAYSAQIALWIAGAAALAALLRIRNPQLLYRGWQLLLVLCLATPLLWPWRAVEPATPAAASGRASAALAAAGPGFSAAAIVLAVIALGILARWLLLAAGLLRLHRMRCAARKLCPIPEPLSRLTADLARNADLYLCSELAGPASFGFRRPAVLLPETFADQDARAQRAVVCHELLHVRRHDWVLALAEETVRGLFWFHPAVWWALERIQLAREQVVDRQVVRLLGERDAYLEALLDTAALRAHTALAAAPSFLRPRHLRQRVELILKEDVMSKKRLTISAAALACAVALLAAWAGSSFPLQAQQKNSRASGEVYKIGDGVSAPRLISKVDPDYTDEAKDAHLQGTIVLALVVGADGAARDVEVRRGLGMGLDENATAAIAKWKFEPGEKDGKPVAVAAVVEMNFRLN